MSEVKDKDKMLEILSRHQDFLESFIVNDSDDIHILKSYVSMLSFLALYYDLPKKTIQVLVNDNLTAMESGLV